MNVDNGFLFNFFLLDATFSKWCDNSSAKSQTRVGQEVAHSSHAFFSSNTFIACMHTIWQPPLTALTRLWKELLECLNLRMNLCV